MVKVLFVCHGNICRSPMAELVLKKMVEILNISSDFHIESKGTSNEEEGNGVYKEMISTYKALDIDYSKHKARQIQKEDYDKFDYIIGFDRYNRVNLYNFFKGDPDKKIHLLLDFTSSPRDIIDPWYYETYDETYNDILLGLRHFLLKLGYQLGEI
jgi:protein-tyrosine phosphatase